jgi:hypothetical protein
MLGRGLKHAGGSKGWFPLRIGRARTRRRTCRDARAATRSHRPMTPAPITAISTRAGSAAAEWRRRRPIGGCAFSRSPTAIVLSNKDHRPLRCLARDWFR